LLLLQRLLLLLLQQLLLLLPPLRPLVQLEGRRDGFASVAAN
jgi:hypothetical protein